VENENEKKIFFLFVELEMGCHENFSKAWTVFYEHWASDRGPFGVNP